MAAWSADETAMLRAAYANASVRADIGLDALAKAMGRNKANVCRKARQLGLTDKARKIVEARKCRNKYDSVEALRAAQSERQKQAIELRGHPRGMAGKSHTVATKERLREASLAYRGRLTKAESSAMALKAMKTSVERHGTIAPMVERGAWKAGWREIGGYRKYYRSRWEANYARYLQWLKERGEIQDWKHEPETFWFDAIKRGVRSYLPDFRVWENNGATPLHEVKGWMDARSKTTLKRMAKYHPQEKIVVIREKDYNAIARTVGPMISGWEQSER